MGNCCSETPSSLLKRHVNHLRKGFTTTISNDEDTRLLISGSSVRCVTDGFAGPTSGRDTLGIARKRPLTLQELLNLQNYINYA